MHFASPITLHPSTYQDQRLPFWPLHMLPRHRFHLRLLYADHPELNKIAPRNILPHCGDVRVPMNSAE